LIPPYSSLPLVRRAVGMIQAVEGCAPKWGVGPRAAEGKKSLKSVNGGWF
jgi:hypothetical protein